jgi:hypothetical protein
MARGLWLVSLLQLACIYKSHFESLIGISRERCKFKRGAFATANLAVRPLSSFVHCSSLFLPMFFVSLVPAAPGCLPRPLPPPLNAYCILMLHIGADRRDDIRSVCSEIVFCTVQHPTMSFLCLCGLQGPYVGDAAVILRYMLTMVTCLQVLRWMM